MRKWDDVKIILLDGKEIYLSNSYFKMRGEAMFCIEDDQGEGHCIPVDNISIIYLKGKPSDEKLSSNLQESINEKKKGFFSIFKK